MEELAMILREHAARYPVMEPTDAVKLIYQNEFGGGHLIRDRETCLSNLRREYAATPHDAAQALLEEIGNGLVRVHLSALSDSRLEALGLAFIRSAAARQGCVDSFKRKLALLRALCADGMFSFDLSSLDAYLSEYERAGFPMVSHSAAYRAAYKPAYRIVSADIWQSK